MFWLQKYVLSEEETDMVFVNKQDLIPQSGFMAASAAFNPAGYTQLAGVISSWEGFQGLPQGIIMSDVSPEIPQKLFRVQAVEVSRFLWE